MKKTAKKPAKKPVRKAAAVHRVREHKQKKARIKPEVLEEARPQAEFDFHGITCDKAEPGEPCIDLGPEPPPYKIWKEGEQATQKWECERLERAQYNSGPKSANATLWDCAPMVEHVLINRSTVELEAFAYEKYGIAYPRFTEDQRRQKCLGLIAMYAMAGDIEVIKWVLSTSPRS